MAHSDNGTVDQHVGRAHEVGLDARRYQELWFKLARRPWASLVLVPAEPGTSTEHVARALAEVGKQLSEGPVTAITAGSLEYGTALALADLPAFVDRKRLPSASRWPTVDLPPSGVEEVETAPGAEAPAVDVPGSEAMVLSSAARIIIAIPPVVSEPLGLATTQEADLIVLCIEVGRTRLANARRAVQLIGRERVAGCFLLP